MKEKEENEEEEEAVCLFDLRKGLLFIALFSSAGFNLFYGQL